MTARMGMAIAIVAAALAVGCQTPAQKQAAQEKKMAMEEQKREQKAAAEKAKQEKAMADAEAKHQKEEAKRIAAEEQAQREAEAKAAEKQRKEAAKIAKENKDAFASDFIRNEQETRSIDYFLHQQAAEGAREDAMLNDAHFDATELNSLGKVKLSLIGHAVPKGSTAPVMVYVNINDATIAQARIAAVQAWWKDSQYSDLNLQIKQGVNENVNFPAKEGLKGLANQEKEKPAEGSVTRNITNNVSGSATPPSP